jgi:hypothetical protein
MQDLQKIINFITTSNWILLLLTSFIALMATPTDVSLGVLLGGLIVAINFHLLKSTLEKMFRPEVVSEQGRSIMSNVLIKYYIRFVISGGLIFLLISKHIVHPLGLLAGLSVVVASMFMATLLELTRILFKEAV